MKLRLVNALLVAAALCAWSGRAHAQMPGGPALVVDARLGVGAGVAGGGNVIVVPSLDVGVRLIDRLQVGLGVGLFRTSGFANGNNANTDTSTTSFTFIPMAAFDILKAKDNRAAFYAKASLPLGGQVASSSVTVGGVTNSQTQTLFVIGYDFAVGARFCPHPNFAVGLEGGLSGIFTDPTGNRGSGITTFYGALVGTFYWGKGT